MMHAAGESRVWSHRTGRMGWGGVARRGPKQQDRVACERAPVNLDSNFLDSRF